MPTNATGRPAPPTPADLAELLGPANDLWIELRRAIGASCGPLAERWVYGGTKYGWSCRLERGKKGIYMTPAAGQFRVGVALSDAAREAALAGDLPAGIRGDLASATRAMEGWPVRLPVQTADDVAVVLMLAEIKFSG
jgi:hypothetical protein